MCNLVMMIVITTIFFYTVTATTKTYTLSLHDALPISNFVGADQLVLSGLQFTGFTAPSTAASLQLVEGGDRKSTRLNSSHRCISYAVFCLKKKNTKQI